MTFGMIKAYDSKHNNEAFADAAAPREKMLLRRSVGMLYRRKRTAAKSKPGRTVVQRGDGVMVVCLRARRFERCLAVAADYTRGVRRAVDSRRRRDALMAGRPAPSDAAPAPVELRPWSAAGSTAAMMFGAGLGSQSIG